MRALGSLRVRAALCAGAVTPLGFAVKFYEGPLDKWLNNSVAGALYEVFWCFVALAVWPRRERVGAIAIGVFVATSALEFLQLVRAPWLDAARGTFAGRAVLGTTFSWWDFAYYAAGSALGWWLMRLVARGSGNGLHVPQDTAI